jgi:hypothetical protein
MVKKGFVQKGELTKVGLGFVKNISPHVKKVAQQPNPPHQSSHPNPLNVV